VCCTRAGGFKSQMKKAMRAARYALVIGDDEARAALSGKRCARQASRERRGRRLPHASRRADA